RGKKCQSEISLHVRLRGLVRPPLRNSIDQRALDSIGSLAGNLSLSVRQWRLIKRNSDGPSVYGIEHTILIFGCVKAPDTSAAHSLKAARQGKVDLIARLKVIKTVLVNVS